MNKTGRKYGSWTPKLIRLARQNDNIITSRMIQDRWHVSNDHAHALIQCMRVRGLVERIHRGIMGRNGHPATHRLV